MVYTAKEKLQRKHFIGSIELYIQDTKGNWEVRPTRLFSEKFTKTVQEKGNKIKNSRLSNKIKIRK
jgi:hypothetical protein